jgi:hypothetical protein
MANLPALRPENTVSDEYADSFGALIAQGQHPRDIARRMHPEDRAARRRTYLKLRRLALQDARVAQYAADDARLEMIVALGLAAKSLGRKAKAGRTDAIKLLFEASGLHNPRVQHEHSGEVSIKVTVPRPDFAATQASDDIVDADVVDES